MTRPLFHQSAEPMRLNVEALRSLPFHERIFAYEDFDRAAYSRRLAKWHLRNKPIGWSDEFRWQMHCAVRAWKRYAAAVRAASQPRKAA